MKNPIIAFSKVSILVLALALSGVSAMASTMLPSIVIRPLTYEKKVRVIMHALTEPAEVQVLDNFGRVLLREKTADAAYARIFDLSKLEAGTYELVIKTGLRELLQPFAIEPKRLTMDTQDQRETFAPVFRNRNGAVDLVWMNRESAPVTVLIKNEAGDIVYTEDFGSRNRLEKRFDISRLDQGAYTMVLQTPNRLFLHQIRK